MDKALAFEGETSSVGWDNITGKPDSYPPETHTHTIANVTNLQNTLNGKANSSHTHSQSDISGLSSALSGKANTSHSHTITDVTGLQDKLDSLEESKSSGLQFISSTSFSADTATYNLNLPDNWVKYKELIVYLIISVNGTVTSSGTNTDTVDLGFNNNITFYNMSTTNTSTKYGLGTKTTARYRGYIRLAPVGGSSACGAVRGEIFALEDLAYIHNTIGYLTEFKLIPRIAANQLTYLKFTCNGSCTMRNSNFSFYALN